MVPFLLVGNSRVTINYVNKIIYSCYVVSSQNHYKIYQREKQMAIQCFSRSMKTFHHVYKNSFNNTTFTFIRLEYIELYSIDGE